LTDLGIDEDSTANRRVTLWVPLWVPVLELALGLASARQCKRNYVPHFDHYFQNGFEQLPD
jgi:hypothetical protein